MDAGTARGGGGGWYDDAFAVVCARMVGEVCVSCAL